MSDHYDIEIEIEGCKRRGQWALKQGAKLCVGGFYGAKTVDLGERRTVEVAREVLRELVLEWIAERERAPSGRQSEPIDKPFPLTVLVNGLAYHGTWRLLGGQVFVYSAYGSDVASVKRSTPERAAERLLKEIVRKWLETPDAP